MRSAKVTKMMVIRYIAKIRGEAYKPTLKEQEDVYQLLHSIISPPDLICKHCNAEIRLIKNCNWKAKVKTPTIYVHISRGSNITYYKDCRLSATPKDQ